MRRSKLHRFRVALVVLLASSFLSCRTVEKMLPYIIVAGGAIASVVALNFLSDCTSSWAVCVDDGAGGLVRDVGYSEQVLLMIGTMTTVAGAAADYYVDQREKARELIELEKVENKVEQDYAALQQQQAAPPANQWGNAWGAPAAVEPARWGKAGTEYADPYGTPPPPGYGPPPGQAPPQGAPAPAASPWGDKYAGGTTSKSAGLGSAPSGQPLALDTALLKDVGGRWVAVLDNDVLYDGRGEATADRFRVYFSPSEDAHVYVVGVDAVGRVQPLYPRRFPDRSNPIRAGEKVLLPDASGAYGLDEFAGLQHIYFYAGRAPNPQLEKQLALFAAKPPPQPAGIATGGNVYVVSEPAQPRGVQGRGLTGVGPGDEVRIPAGAAGFDAVFPLRASAADAASDLVTMRYFQHQ
jgi:type II secretory pathway pseudopilin PulG